MQIWNTVLLDSLDVRWPDAQIRAQNRYYLDSRWRLLSFCDWRTVALNGLTLQKAAQIVQEYLDYRRSQGYSPISIDNDRRNLSAAFAWARSRGLLPFNGNPCSYALLHTPPVTVRCKPPVTDAELDAMIVRCRISPIHPQFLLCLTVGMRPIGACRVRAGDVNLQTRTVAVTEKRRERIVPLSDFCCQELTQWLTQWDWAAWSESNVMRHFRRIRLAAGLPAHVTLQGLRRTFLKKCLEADIPAQKAAALAGNSIQTIQRHYVQLSTLNARDAVDKLQFNLGGQGR